MSFDPGINHSAIKRHEAMEKQMRQLARQEASEEAIQNILEEGDGVISNMAEREMRNKAKKLEDRTGSNKQEVKETQLFGMEESEVVPMQEGELNPELDVKTLLILKAHINEDDSLDDVQQKVLEAYGDYSLADDALAYLEKISEGKQIELIRDTRSKFNDIFGREIKAGKNISAEARAFSTQGLGSPTALRDLYRDITGNPRTPNQLFEELANRFDFENLKKVVKFLLNSLGRDLKAKGPSIPKALLYRLLTETRNLQAIYALYLFFKSRMNILYRGFDRHDLYFPKELTFELMARLFMDLLDDRYPSPVKVIKMSPKMGIEDEILSQMMVYTQFRDAVRNVAPKLYRNIKHRQELLNAYLDALEELDEALEEEIDEEDED